MENWKLCVPTYGRKNPLILRMLDNDDELEINFFVRQEDINAGFYDELALRDRVNIISLGFGLHELGETRQRIIDWCLDNGVRYCCMFDDGITNVDHACCAYTISEIFDTCIALMQHDKYHDKMVGWSFHKRWGIYEDGRQVRWNDANVADEEYFLTMPAQALIIDCYKMTDNNITYKSLDEVGFEDCAFFADCVKKGLIFGARRHIRIDGIVPNQKKKGGSHVDSESPEEKYDIQNARCMKYIGPMMGVRVEKRYRSLADGLMSYIIFNTDYYREVLCDKPEQNKEIIESQFMIPWEI